MQITLGIAQVIAMLGKESCRKLFADLPRKYWHPTLLPRLKRTWLYELDFKPLSPREAQRHSPKRTQEPTQLQQKQERKRHISHFHVCVEKRKIMVIIKRKQNY